jgi:hypothetical protein
LITTTFLSTIRASQLYNYEDRFEYKSPLGSMGRLADLVFLKRYMERLLRTRADVIRLAAEAGEIPE